MEPGGLHSDKGRAALAPLNPAQLCAAHQENPTDLPDFTSGVWRGIIGARDTEGESGRERGGGEREREGNQPSACV